MDDLRYPIGPFRFEDEVTPDRRRQWTDEIAATPDRLRRAVRGLTDEQLGTPYRPGGWTVRQVVHHVADSHMNGYIRFRLALTEAGPTIQPYAERAWAELADARTAPPEVSLALLEALHQRWVMLLRAMDAAGFARTFYHPEAGQHLSLDRALALFAWHGRHHTAHIQSLGERMGW